MLVLQKAYQPESKPQKGHLKEHYLNLEVQKVKKDR